MTPLKKAFRFLASYELSIVLLTLLLVVVFLGTVEQARIGLYAAQENYFYSVVAWFPHGARVATPLPGGYLLSVLLCVNLLCGGVLAAPKRWRRPGLLIGHAGVLLLMGAGFVSFHLADEGHVTLFEGQSSDRMVSYHEWQLQVTELGAEGGGRRFILAQDRIEETPPYQWKDFTHPDLPFTLRTGLYLHNARPVMDAGAPADGVALAPEREAASRESNLPGITLRLEGPGASVVDGIVWAGEQAPWVAEVGGRQYMFQLARRSWPLPFVLRLDKFTHERHPGTSIPATFSSALTVREAGAERQVDIRMNAPFRHRPHTFFQASWGPQDAREGDPLYSVLAVTRNPAEDWPMYASLVISAGLLLHFVQALLTHLRAEAKRRAAP